jgi:polyisoprenoid-binding protein YceI
MVRAVLAAVLCMGVVVPAWANQLELELDPDRTTVSFVLGATMHKVRGGFRLERGEVSYDPATGVASGEVAVDARSGDSGNEKRDRHMHQKVLESESHPTIVLRPRRVEGELPAAGEGRLTLLGSMILHGGEHEVEIPLTVNVDGASIRISAEFDVPYVEWGLKDPSKLVLRVAKLVTVKVEAEGMMTADP